MLQTGEKKMQGAAHSFVVEKDSVKLPILDSLLCFYGPFDRTNELS